MEIAVNSGKLNSVKNMLIIQGEKGISTAYVEDVLRRIIKSDTYSLEVVEELVQHITIKGKTVETKAM